MIKTIAFVSFLCVFGYASYDECWSILYSSNKERLETILSIDSRLKIVHRRIISLLPYDDNVLMKCEIDRLIEDRTILMDALVVLRKENAWRK